MPLSTIASLAGPLISGLGSFFGQQSANSANMAMQQQNQQWQTQMSNTAVQRRSADMTAAGINPILAAGNPASQPVGSLIPQQNAIGAGVSAATQAYQAETQGQMARAQIDNINADTKQKEYITDTKLPQDVENLKAQYGLTSAQATNAKALLTQIQSQTSLQDTQENNARLQGLIINEQLQVRQAVRQELIKQVAQETSINEQTLAGLTYENATAKVYADLANNPAGRALLIANKVIATAGGAVGLVNSARGMMTPRAPSMSVNPETEFRYNHLRPGDIGNE